MEKEWWSTIVKEMESNFVAKLAGFLIFGILLSYLLFVFIRFFFFNPWPSFSKGAIVSTDTTNSIPKDTISVNSPTKTLEKKETSKMSKHSKSKDINQNNDKGKNEVNQNFGENYGNIGGSNNTVINEKQLGEQDKKKILELLTQVKQEKNTTTNCVILLNTSDSNAGKYTSQLEEFLKQNGYVIGGRALAVRENTNGINVYFAMGCLNISIGVL